MTMLTLDRRMQTRDVVRLLKGQGVEGIIVPRGQGDPNEVDKLRLMARRPTLQVWFLGLDDGSREFVHWYEETRRDCRRFVNMDVRRGDESG